MTHIIYWAFLCPALSELFGRSCVELNVVNRQADAAFSEMLRHLRRGVVTLELRSVLEDKMTKSEAQDPEDGDATLICARKEDALAYNSSRLLKFGRMYGGIHQFGSKNRFYLATDTGKKNGLLALNSDLHVSARLELSLHSRVSYRGGGGPAMADIVIVNGSTGKVVSFDAKSELPVVCFGVPGGGSIDILCEPTAFEVPSISGGVLASREQLPIHLSWAITVHRCQSISLDEVELDLLRAFCHGMVYVATSRVRTLVGLQLRSLDLSRIVVDPAVIAFYDALQRL